METIFEIFEKYGWPGVLGIAAIGAIFLLIKYLNNKLSEDVKDGMSEIATTMSNTIREQNKELVSSIKETNDKLIDHIINKDKNEQKEHVEKLEARIDVTSDINEKLKEIMLDTGAARVCIMEFHNTSQNLVGIPFAKYSCNFEWFRKGVQPLSQKCQNMPFSSIASVVKDILEEETNQVIYPTLDTIGDTNPQLYALLKDHCRAQSVIYIGLHDSCNNLIGLLVLEFHSEIPKHIKLNQLAVEAAQITSVLNLRQKYTSIV